MVILPELIFLFLAVAASKDVDWSVISKGIIKGDHTAFRKFYDANYASVYRFLISRGVREEDAQDLIQKAFLMIWEKRDQIDPQKSLRAYLFQIIYTRMLNHIQYNSKFAEVEDIADNLVPVNSESGMDYNELLRVVRGIISKMPEKRSLVFEMCFMKEFSYKEAAEAMQVSVKTIENHMALAFKELRTALLKIYGEDQVKNILNLNT
jgi:RNA polymerase sigma-70 factor (ECF subfamily)